MLTVGSEVVVAIVVHGGSFFIDEGAAKQRANRKPFLPSHKLTQVLVLFHLQDTFLNKVEPSEETSVCTHQWKDQSACVQIRNSAVG